MYSEKMMEHFRHPKNMGEIENPDGVGTVGNPVCGDLMSIYIKVKDNRLEDVKFKTFGCLPKGEEVVSGDGMWKEVSTVNTEKLLGKSGNSISIKQKYIRNYSGKVLKIIPFVSPFNSFIITPNHPVFAVKREWMKKSRKANSLCKWLKVDRKELFSAEPVWIDACDISEGDYLIFVPPAYSADIPYLTEDLMKLFGYYLAEGYIGANSSVVAFAFNRNEKGNIRELKTLISRITGKKPTVRIRKNVAEVYICSRKLVRLLKRYCGSLARNKKISEEIIGLPSKKQLKLFLTYFKGDGNKYTRRPGNSETYRSTTVSKHLAIQIQQILARNGIFASIRKSSRKSHLIENREIKGRDQYLLSFKTKRKHILVHLKDGCFLVPVKNVEEINYSGNVYNFDVCSQDHSYLVKGFVVHNCAAAIATSSMITEMAKGKTIDEALKINRNNVADALDGLPPIKMHCSNLAADGLHAAIKDYLSKKGKQ